ncbi:response regulator [Spirosoma sp. HMF4905]|uniref:Response regulator n=1 Tax=Spirosoma arboris TaxID=2682092 RepID=A0A7K1SIL9_9BACT|nr:LytTR family DNA-binding domain-containing protein [Spirosoma arboris]MVM33669.1 response regulator [Spirosoma arboris]
MNVVLVEDEKLTARRLEGLLKAYDPAITVLTVLTSVAKGVAWFADRAQQGLPQPDLLFLDIHLEDDSGFRLIERAGLTLPVIFTTAYDQYTLQAFKTNSIDYLLKPIDANELGAALDKFKRLRASATAVTQPDLTALLKTLQTSPSPYKNRFMVTIGTKIRSIHTSEIAYFYYEEKSTWLTTHDGQHISLEYSLDKLIAMLDPGQFFRVNRAFLVSMEAIRTIHTYSGSKLKLDLQPLPRQEVFVSNDRLADFKEWLGK